MLYLYIYIHNTLFISEQNILSNKNMLHTNFKHILRQPMNMIYKANTT